MVPVVTTLLPVFNGAPGLPRAIASIRQQTFAPWELLIVDDGSTDGSAEIAVAAAADDERIRVLRCPHGGIVDALNAGLAHARGRLIARMDADDESFPNRFAEQVRLLDSSPGIGLASCLVVYGGDRNANTGYALHVDWINSVVTPHDIALNRFVESPLAHPSVMFRRELVGRHGSYRSGNFPEDYELWLRWLDAGVGMAKVREPLLRWNDSPSRLSRADGRYSVDAFFETKAPWLASELHRRGAGTGTPASLPVWIWGAGRHTRKRAAHLAAQGVTISGFVDVDAKKAGNTVQGVPVVLPTMMPRPAEAFVLGYVTSRGARDLIRYELRSRGFIEGQHFLMCA